MGDGEVRYPLSKRVDRAVGHFASERVDLYAEV